uniref:right-handed parallel beta-helix repeat-containing protein n=1 Tax=Arhodomonas sp. AD133 TaxID=3415009 RepID=UPI003EB97B4A
DGPSQGSPGAWSGISFNGSSHGSRLQGVTVRYGRRNLYLYRSSLTLRESTLAEASAKGIDLNTPDAASQIVGNEITGSGKAGIKLYGGTDGTVIRGNRITNGSSHAIYAVSNTPVIADNELLDNAGHGVYFNSAGGGEPLTGNTITGNAVALRVPFSMLPAPGGGNVLAPNERSVIEIVGDTRTAELRLPLGDIRQYRLHGDATVAAGTRMRVAEGVVWKAGGSGSQLFVKGALLAEGTAESPVVFTSYRDDSAGGDTNGDGASTGAPGDWGGLVYQGEATPLLSGLTHTEIRYAGGNNNSRRNAALVLNAPVTVSDSAVVASARNGIRIDKAGARVERTTVRGSDWSGITVEGDHWNDAPAQLEDNVIRDAGGQGIRVHSAAPSLVDNDIRGGGEFGIQYTDTVRHGPPVIRGNTVVDNERGVRLPASALPGPDAGNVLVPNHRDGVWVVGTDREADLELAVQEAAEGEAQARTYHVSGELHMRDGTQLAVAPGVVMKFAPEARLRVDGGLSVPGTASAPVVFTSERDDARGGDFNADGYASLPRPGDWRGLELRGDDAAATLSHVEVRYAGGNGDPAVSARERA